MLHLPLSTHGLTDLKISFCLKWVLPECSFFQQRICSLCLSLSLRGFNLMSFAPTTNSNHIFYYHLPLLTSYKLNDWIEMSYLFRCSLLRFHWIHVFHLWFQFSIYFYDILQRQSSPPEMKSLISKTPDDFVTRYHFHILR